jgi:aspartyl-tRNA(Asn)/glutamyl-tRNA(Gln) amidotransferase subunit A
MRSLPSLVKQYCVSISHYANFCAHAQIFHRSSHILHHKNARTRKCLPASPAWTVHFPADGVDGLDVNYSHTYGLVSCRGVLSLSWSLDHVGPLPSAPEDCALLQSVFGRHDSSDPYSAPRDLIDDVLDNIAALLGSTQTSHRLRLGVVPQLFDTALTPELWNAVAAAVSMLEEQTGAEVVELDLDPDVLDSILHIYPVEAAAYHCKATHGRWTDRGAMLRAELQDALKPTGVHYIDAQRTRLHLSQAFQTLYRRADLLLWPAQQFVAPPLGTTDAAVPGRVGDATTIEIEIMATAPTNLLGEPAISIPCGSAKGLPVGLHIQGP